MENLGEIMKSCHTCMYAWVRGECIECNSCGSNFNNWKPIEGFEPIPMQEIKVEDYEVKSQADGLVQLMSKVDEALFENTTQQIPEPTQEQTQNYNNTILKQLAKPQGRTHYYKFTLDFCEDYSIRFFLEFSDRKDYEGNWYLKSHKLKEYSLLSKDMAEDLIRKSCTTFVEEIIGRRSGKKYEKIVVSKDKLVKFVE